MSDEQTQAADDPSGDGWAWVAKGDTVREGDMWRSGACSWCAAERVGETVQYNAQYRRRIEPPQPSDSEPETMDDLRRRLDEYAVLVAEAERSGQQINAEMQQLREQLATSQHLAEMSRRQVADEAGKVERLKEQVATLTLERDRLQSSLRDHYRDGHQRATLALQSWLRPVLELVAEHPDDCGPLAVSVLGYLPGIASRLIEE